MVFSLFDKENSAPLVAWDEVKHPTSAREDNLRALQTQWGHSPKTPAPAPKRAAPPRRLVDEIREIIKAQIAASEQAITATAQAIAARKQAKAARDPATAQISGELDWGHDYNPFWVPVDKIRYR